MLQRYKKNRTLASFYSLNMRLFLLNSTTGLFQCPLFAPRLFHILTSFLEPLTCLLLKLLKLLSPRLFHLQIVRSDKGATAIYQSIVDAIVVDRPSSHLHAQRVAGVYQLGGDVRMLDADVGLPIMTPLYILVFDCLAQVLALQLWIVRTDILQ